MVDYLTLALTHGLMAIALWRLLARPELDAEQAEEPRRPWIKVAQNQAEEGHGDA